MNQEQRYQEIPQYLIRIENILSALDEKSDRILKILEDVEVVEESSTEPTPSLIQPHAEVIQPQMDPYTEKTQPWMDEAWKWVGKHEDDDKDEILAMLRLAGCTLTSLSGTQNAWCTWFVRGILNKVGISELPSGNSMNFLNWGQDCGKIIGATAVFPSHVAFVTAIEPEIKILGGNQSDKICEYPTRYGFGTPVGYRYPKGFKPPAQTGVTT